jgi:L-ascorbate metabolism protein UlaG (beta-lactamase superfamily)
MKRNLAKVITFIFLVAVSGCAQVKKPEPLKREQVEKPAAVKNGATLNIRYIANEGVMITSAGKQVLIDGLHREYKPAYLFPPPELKAVLENARAPYDKINLVLVSHIHLDHFHPESIGLYLKGNPKAMFASSEQAVGEVAKSSPDYEGVRSRIRPIIHEWKKTSELNHEGIRVRFLGLRHGSERFKDIQNLGHVIEIGGKKLLHIGDADMTAENFSAFNLAQEKIDIAFIPYWFLMSEDGRKLVREQFNPKNIIAVHVPPAEAQAVIDQLRKDLPEATAFTKTLEELDF